jgi:hypothetical protein
MPRVESRKRAAPEPTAGYTLAKWVEDATWKFNKSNWKKQGEAEYKKLKGKVDRGRALDGFEEYLMSVHFPKIAPTRHPIAGKEASASKKRKAASAPVFGDGGALSQVYLHYLEISCEITSYMEFV